MKRVIVFLLAFLLTGTLILFSVSFISQQIILPAMNENGAQVSDKVIRQEQQLIRERITKMAELYGFEAEPVISIISEETLRDLHYQASLWWSTVLQDGKVGKELSWDTEELEELLASDTLLKQHNQQQLSDDSDVAIADEVRRSVIRMVLPMREQIIRLGLQEVGKRIDLLSLVTFLQDVPWALLALCALLAGVIAMMNSRRFHGARLFIGSALGGAALVLAVLMILYQHAGILQMIQEASEGLAIQYGSIVSGAMLRGILLTAVMAAGCILCLLRGRKSGKTV